MDKFLTYTAGQRERAIRETAARMQLHPTPVEKDFWACWLLRQLFSLTCVQDQLIFKGGTSLSKGYGVIERFSEDIDLSVHASAFGVAIEPNFDELSKSQRDNRINEPAEARDIQPYIAAHYPQLFDQPHTPLKVLAARRTFWEKATILHAESIRPADQPMPRRLARHAYDLHQLMQSGIGQAALAEPELLERVAKHKSFFYTQAKVDYEAAYTGGLKVVPEGARVKELADDYNAMRDFFMSEPPKFSDILKSLQRIEQQTNSSNS